MLPEYTGTLHAFDEELHRAILSSGPLPVKKPDNLFQYKMYKCDVLF